MHPRCSSKYEFSLRQISNAVCQALLIAMAVTFCSPCDQNLHFLNVDYRLNHRLVLHRVLDVAILRHNPSSSVLSKCQLPCSTEHLCQSQLQTQSWVMQPTQLANQLHKLHLSTCLGNRIQSTCGHVLLPATSSLQQIPQPHHPVPAATSECW